MEDLYGYVQAWGTVEENVIPFPSWKGVDEYQDPIYPRSLSTKFAAVFPEVASLLNSHVERMVILNDNTQDNNKVLGDKRNETVKFHRMDSIIEEVVSTFQSVIESEQQNGGLQKK